MSAQAALYGSKAALDIIGGYYASQNIRETAALNRDIANMNAQFAELDAYDAIKEGYSQQARYQSVIDNTISQQNLAIAASGGDATYGTTASLQEETEFIAQLNLMEIEKRAQEKALGYTQQARQFKMGGEISYAQDQIRAQQALYSGVSSAINQGVAGYRRSQ